MIVWQNAGKVKDLDLLWEMDRAQQTVMDLTLPSHSSKV